MNTAGLAGALIATFGCILPSCILVTFIAYFYFKISKLAALQGILSSLRPAVIALIASAGISILGFCLLERTDCDPSAGYRLGTW